MLRGYTPTIWNYYSDPLDYSDPYFFVYQQYIHQLFYFHLCVLK